eukprot:TRINITY_DN81228_c0_g1_i1.p1 TRINITY_DN81228_c0_g1~~TRINITY_DN81228_c0_g1_i1.p1  ORF type:complete len:348 (+),score=64.65 TRINITY_DN81228_c0_g1_i1:84-1127(+)
MFSPKGAPFVIGLAINASMFTFIGLVIIALLPQKILKKSKLLRNQRNRIVKAVTRCLELTAEGPFFRLFVFLGKRFIGGRLSSRCRAPTNIKVINHTSYEVLVEFSPTVGWNAFHEENYVIAYKRQSDDEWIQREMSAQEECEDITPKAGEKERQKKGERYKCGIDNLTEFTPIVVKVAAVNHHGLGPWGREFKITTMARPYKDMGFKGPLGPAAAATGSGKTEYRWAQTKNEVHIRIPLGKDVKSKDIKFKALPKKLEIRFGDAPDGKDVLLSGYLIKPVTADEVTWYIDENADEGRHMSITMFKHEIMDKWNRIFDSDEHPMVDDGLIRFYTDALMPGSLGDLYE